MAGAKAPPTSLPAHPTDARSMIARSNPTFDAVCMARELVSRIGDEAATKITRETSIRTFYNAEQIHSHGEDFLKMVLARVAFTNVVRNVAVDWARRNCRHRGKTQKLWSTTTPHDLFRTEDLQKHPPSVIDAALLYLRESLREYMLQAPHFSFSGVQRSQLLPLNDEPLQPSPKPPNVHATSTSVPQHSLAKPQIDQMTPLYGLQSRRGDLRSSNNHARSDGFPMRRMVSEPANAASNARATPILGQPPLLSSQRHGNTRQMSSHFHQQPQHSHGTNPQNPPFFPESLAPTLHGQMLRNNLANFHGIPIMHLPHGHMPALTSFVPAGAFAVHHAMAHSTGPVMAFNTPYPATDTQNIPRERSENMRSQQHRPDKSHGPKRLQDTKPSVHTSQWRVKQSPPSHPFSESQALPAGLEEPPVEQRIMKDSIGADIEHIFKLWVHGIPQSATVGDVQQFFEETVAVSAIKNIRSDKHNINYTYVTFHSTEDARKALTLDGGELKGHKLLVQVCHSDINYGTDSPRKASYNANRLRKSSRASTHSPVDIKNQGSFSPQDARSGDYHKGSRVASGSGTAPITRAVTPESSPSKKTRPGKKQLDSNIAQSTTPKKLDLASTNMPSSAPQSEKGEDLKNTSTPEVSTTSLEKEDSEQSLQGALHASIVDLSSKQSIDKPSDPSHPSEASATQGSLEPTTPALESSAGEDTKGGTTEASIESKMPVTSADSIELASLPDSVLAPQSLQESLPSEQVTVTSSSSAQVESLPIDQDPTEPPTSVKNSNECDSEHSTGEARVASPLQAIPEVTELHTETTAPQAPVDGVGDRTTTKSIVQSVVPPATTEPVLETMAGKPSSKKNGPAQTESLNPFAAIAKAKKAEAAAKKKEKKKARVVSNAKGGGLSDITNRETSALNVDGTKLTGNDRGGPSKDKHATLSDQSFLEVAEAGEVVGELVEPFRQYSAHGMQEQWDRYQGASAHDRSSTPGRSPSSKMVENLSIPHAIGTAPAEPLLQLSPRILALGPKAKSTQSQFSNGELLSGTELALVEVQAAKIDSDHVKYRHIAESVDNVGLVDRRTSRPQTNGDVTLPSLINRSNSMIFSVAPVTDRNSPVANINDTFNSSISSILESEVAPVPPHHFPTTPRTRKHFIEKSHLVQAAPSRGSRKKKKKKAERGRARSTVHLVIDEGSSSSPTLQLTEPRVKLAALNDRQHARTMLMRSLRELEYLQQLQKHLKAGDEQLARSFAVHLGLFRKWREEGVTLQQPFTLAVAQYSDEVSRRALTKVLSGEINRGVKDAGFSHPREFAQMQSETRLFVQEEMFSIRARHHALSEEDFQNEARKEALMAERLRNDERHRWEHAEKMRLLLRNLELKQMGMEDQQEQWIVASDDQSDASPPSGEYHGLGLGEERLPLPKYDVLPARRAGGIEEFSDAPGSDWNVELSDSDTLEEPSTACDNTVPSVTLVHHPGTSG